MATTLTKPVARLIPRANLIVTLTEEGVYVREPRKRTNYGPLAYSAIQYYAAKAMADAQRAEKDNEKAIKAASA